MQTAFLKNVGLQSVIRMMEDFRNSFYETAKICWYSTQRRSQHQLEVWTPSVVHAKWARCRFTTLS